MKILILFLIRIYQKCISPFLGKNCRFYTSCSEFTYQSIEKHGMIKGIYKGSKRLLTCHPFYSNKNQEII